MKKKLILSFLIILIMTMSTVTVTVTAGTDEISVFYNGEKIVFDVDPVIMDGRTLVPMRAIFEAFGASVDYNPGTKQITAVKGALKIMLTIGNPYSTVSNEGIITETDIDVPPFTIEGRTFVPLRYIGEALGATVNWNGQTKTVSIIRNSSGSISMSASDIAKLMAPRSVIIFCYDEAGRYMSQGSGFFINSAGQIVTNFHVIDGAKSAVVVMEDESEHEVDILVHYDRERDLAVLKIDKIGNKYVTLGDSSLVETGNRIFAYGSPLGISNTISEGIISNRNVVMDGYSYIQISSPVSPGSSGGAVADEKGRVIGVVCSYLAGGQNMNFAVPINDLKELLQETPANIPFGSLEPEGSEDLPYYRETEPNNDTGSAQMIHFDCYVFGTYGSSTINSDLDYYRIDIETAGSLLIIGIWGNMDYGNSIYTEDLLIGLAHSDGTIFSEGKMGGASDDSYIYIEEYLEPGTYYIVVTSAFDYRYLYMDEDYALGVYFE